MGESLWLSSSQSLMSSILRHFFGQSCIEKWLRGASSCPNCNEKAARKDVRPHYVARLAALDTGERDRALAGNDSNVSAVFLI